MTDLDWRKEIAESDAYWTPPPDYPESLMFPPSIDSLVSLSYIPHTIYRIWFGGDMPGTFRLWGDQWQEMNPDWEMQEVDDYYDLEPSLGEELEKYGLSDYFYNADLYTSDPHRWHSDILRLLLIYHQGGLYIDCDTEPIRPLSFLGAWLTTSGFLLPSPNTSRFVLCNGVIAASKHHPFILKCIQHLAHHIKERVQSTLQPGTRFPTNSTKYVTGPYAVTKAFAEGDITVLPSRLFFPQTIRDRDQGKPVNLTESVAWHHWNTTAKRRGKGIT